jgi:hypothetical protein
MEINLNCPIHSSSGKRVDRDDVFWISLLERRNLRK